jgi:hypothetical protein
LRERIIAFERAAEPDILSMPGTDPHAKSGGMHTGAPMKSQKAAPTR